MMDKLLLLVDQQFMISLLAAIAVFATIMTLALPYLQKDRLSARLKTVANRREELRAKQREALEQRVQLRPTSTGYMKKTVEHLNLHKLLDTEEARVKLAKAGFRGQPPLITFLFFRLVMPFVVFAGALVYVFLLDGMEGSASMKVLASLGAAVAGFFLPNLFVENLISRRQDSIRKAFPDALDLLLICVESGMSIEAAFNRVAAEIGSQSVEMAEEMSLTTAELSYLPERRIAYENLAERTGLEGVKAVVTALIQAERYGTPLGTALRVMAQENRDMRMSAAEKKAAALPAKLTVPMILFFLPVLFVVILGPSIIRVMNL